MITNKKYKVDHASLSDEKLINGFAKKLHFDIREVGKDYTQDRTLIRLLKSPGLMASASGFQKQNFNYLILTNYATGKNSEINNNENIVIVDKILEYKCISKNNINFCYLKVYTK